MAPMANSQSISDSRVWLVTGSSRGLGRHLVDTILAAGERVVATLRTPSALADLQSKYPSSQLLIQPLDVSSPSQIVEAFEATKRHFNRLDVVVNNAGYGILAEVEATPDEEARKLMEVLYWGPVNITREAIRFYREVNPAGHGGCILNIGSAAGYRAYPNLAFYSSAKFALEGFTDSFIQEMPPAWNIKGCMIEPGGLRTKFDLVALPQHPAYTSPLLPSSQFRIAIQHDVDMIGDPARAALAIFKLADEPELPLRLQLGSDAFHVVRDRARMTLSDQDKWRSVSYSTDEDGHGKKIFDEVAGVLR